MRLQFISRADERVRHDDVRHRFRAGYCTYSYIQNSVRSYVVYTRCFSLDIIILIL